MIAIKETQWCREENRPEAESVSKAREPALTWMDAEIDNLYITRINSADVNILGRVRLMPRESLCISVRRDRE